MKERITSPELPVSLSEAKLYLRLDGNEEDSLIRNLILAALNEAEARTGRAFAESVWKVVFDGDSLSSATAIPVVPCASLVSVTCNHEDGTEISSTAYTVQFSSTSGDGVARICISPSDSASITSGENWTATVVVTGGYSTCPEPVKAWILQRIATLYEQRTSISIGTNIQELGHDFADALLDPYILHGGF